MSRFQLLVPAIALAGGLASRAMVLAPEVPISTAVFAGMWLVPGWLFRKAAQGVAVPTYRCRANGDRAG